MATKKHKRSLLAIVFADIAGYTSMMQANELEALEKLERFKVCLTSECAKNDGTIVLYQGDGCLMTFPSALEAITCCQSLQLLFRDQPIVPVRIGIHLGDVVHKEGNIFGDSVNIASRVESIGIPGAVLFSESIQRCIVSHPNLKHVSLGKFEFKNVNKPLEVYALATEHLAIPKRESIKGKLKTKPSGSNNLSKPASLRSFLTTGIAVFSILVVSAMFYKWGAPIQNSIPNDPVEKQIDKTDLKAPLNDSKDQPKFSFAYGTFIDNRDGEEYRWVEYPNIGKWMSQNLRFSVDQQSWCYNKTKVCEKYGRLYTWEAAQQACPTGWRLTTQDDWNQLIQFFGGPTKAFKTLRKVEESGFSLVLGGVFNQDGKFNFLNHNGNYWSQESLDENQGLYFNFSKELEKVYPLRENKEIAFSCRCVQ